MSLNTLKYNLLMPLRFKGLKVSPLHITVYILYTMCSRHLMSFVALYSYNSQSAQMETENHHKCMHFRSLCAKITVRFSNAFMH